MPTPWNQLPEELVIKRELYEDLASFLVHEHVSPKTKKPLGHGSVGDYIGVALTLSRNRCEKEGSADAQRFFKCHLKDCADEVGRWYRGLRANAEGAAWKRDVNAGEEMDKSAVCIYLKEHIEVICARLAQEGSAQSATTKFEAKTLWRSVGRGGECAFANADDLSYDQFYTCPFIPVAQTKTQKVQTHMSYLRTCMSCPNTTTCMSLNRTYMSSPTTRHMCHLFGHPSHLQDAPSASSNRFPP